MGTPLSSERRTDSASGVRYVTHLGKDWAKGLTAATDPRVARMAASRRGMTYAHHLRPEDDKRYRSNAPRTLPLVWSGTMAYVVGLMATDGCLVNTGRHLSFDSADRELVETFLTCLGRGPRYRTVRTSSGGRYFKALFSDIRFYRWLQGIGLTQRKSLTLGGIDVPEEYLLATVRGLLDGDGSIANFTHAPTPTTYPRYRYERLWTYFNSGSRPHLEWLRSRLAPHLGTDGYLELRRGQPPRHDFYRLKYGKRASIALLGALYEDRDAPCLLRKRSIWDGYLTLMGLAPIEQGRRTSHCAAGGTRTLTAFRP